MTELLSVMEKYFAVGINEPSAIAYKLIPADSNIKSANVGMELSAASAANPAVGIAVTKTFKLLLPYEKPNLPKHNLRIKVGVNENITSALTGGDTYRINVDILKNGTSILAAKKNGQTRTTGTGVANTLTNHVMQFEVPSTTFKVGDTYEVVIEIEVTAVNRGTGSLTYTLNYDPNTTDKQLFVEVEL